jgi:hypothetical protein
LPEIRFTDGNLIILYSIHQNPSSSQIPSHVIERINICDRLYQIILRSKPDADKTIILLVADPLSSELLKTELINRGIDEKIIKTDSESRKISNCLNNLNEFLIKRVNPPYIYFVGSIWMKDVFDSIIKIHFQEYKIQFEGALDHRPVEQVEKEKALETPKKGKEYFKGKVKNKTLDILLNYIFPEDK